MHPHLVEFARIALGDDDLRIYQAAVWDKWAGAVNYEQPLHQQGNHSLLPPRMEPVAFRPAQAEWFGYDAFGRLGNSGTFRRFAAGKSPEDLALFGVPRPGHPYWNEATVDAMAEKYPGLDVTPWRAALGAGATPS